MRRPKTILKSFCCLLALLALAACAERGPGPPGPFYRHSSDTRQLNEVGGQALSSCDNSLGSTAELMSAFPNDAGAGTC